MKRLRMKIYRVVCVRLWDHFRALRDSCHGQDMIEYALMAGLIATGIVTMSPAVADNITLIMSKVNSTIVLAAAS